ncbi:MAG: chloride channel protein [Candidatus Aminicenantes bacterium]|nr:chloride channel protein [Candidatus Aminicenantes bacterium]
MDKLPKFTRLFVFALLVGIIAGFGALIFDWVLRVAEHYLMVKAMGFVPPKPGGEGEAVFILPKTKWLLPVILAIGGVIAGFLIYTFAPETEGHGTDSAIEAFHFKKGKIRWRVPIIKTLASAVTIGSGGSAGREGPIAQIGAGFGSFLADIFKLPTEMRRILVVVGIGAGIGSIFRAPFGGALFAVEVLYTQMDIEMESLIPTLIGSILGFSIFGSLHGWKPIFVTSGYKFSNPAHLLLYGGLGIFLGLMVYPYVKLFYGTRDLFSKINIPRMLKPALGGLLLGIIAIFYPYCIGIGYGWIQLAMVGGISLATLSLLPFAKMLATSLSISSGGSGGIFGPTIVIGGTFGALYSIILNGLFPALNLPLEPFVVVGMAGYISSVAKVPLAGLIMTMEMTGGYGLIVPALAVIIFGLLLSGDTTIYEKQVPNKLSSPAHIGDFMVDVLEGLTVKDALPFSSDVIWVAESTPLSTLLNIFSNSRADVLCVKGSDTHEYRGIISLNHVRDVILQGDELFVTLILAHDLITHSQEVLVKEDENLKNVLQKFTQFDLDELPVIESDGKIRKMISRNSLLIAYSKAFEV